MTEGSMRMLGNYTVTVYENALGTCLVAHTVNGPQVKIVGPQDSPCVHFLSPAEARETAAELCKVAAEAEAEQGARKIVMTSKAVQGTGRAVKLDAYVVELAEGAWAARIAVQRLDSSGATLVRDLEGDIGGLAAGVAATVNAIPDAATLLDQEAS